MRSVNKHGTCACLDVSRRLCLHSPMYVDTYARCGRTTCYVVSSSSSSSSSLLSMSVIEVLQIGIKGITLALELWRTYQQQKELTQIMGTYMTSNTDTYKHMYMHIHIHRYTYTCMFTDTDIQTQTQRHIDA